MQELVEMYLDLRTPARVIVLGAVVFSALWGACCAISVFDNWRRPGAFA